MNNRQKAISLMKNGRPGSFVTDLTLVFIILKLMGQIDWNWAMVLSPMWITTVYTLMLAGAIALLERK